MWNVDCGTTVYSVHSGRVGLVSELTSRGAPTTAVVRRELDHRPPHTGGTTGLATASASCSGEV